MDKFWFVKTKNKIDYQASAFYAQANEDDPERVVRLSACGRELGILPTVWTVISQGLNNFVLYSKDNRNFNFIFSDSVEMKVLGFEQK